VTRQIQLTAFEHYMLADDRDAYPMTFLMRLRLSGRVDEAKLRAAVAPALARHPLLRSRVLGDPFGPGSQLFWEVDDAAEPHWDLGHESEPLRYPQGRRRIDLSREIGLRLFVRRGAEHVDLTAQFHHVSVDGAGAFAFLEDLLAHYAAACGEPLALRPLDEDLLATRGRFHMRPDVRRRRRFKDWERILRFFRTLPEPLPRRLADGDPRPGHVGVPPAVECELTAKEIERLRNGARLSGATVNDALLAGLFRTLDAWSAEARAPRRRHRLAMAINMRTAADIGMPAANVVSMVFLDRSAAELRDPAQALASVVAETRDVKTHGMGYALIRIAERASRWRGGMRHLVTLRRPWRCHTTTVLTNLGRAFHGSPLRQVDGGLVAAGDLVLQSIDVLPPVRHGTRVAFGVIQYAGGYFISAHYDEAAITRATAQDLLVRYVATLREAMVDAEGVRASFRERLLTAESLRPTTPFRSLPIGKNVAPAPLPPALPSEG
jgi:NRPS condensation-like uncharacterized protein